MCGVPETSIREILGSADNFLREGEDFLESAEREILAGGKYPWVALENKLKELEIPDRNAYGLVRSFVEGFARELNVEETEDRFVTAWVDLVRRLQTPL